MSAEPGQRHLPASVVAVLTVAQRTLAYVVHRGGIASAKDRTPRGPAATTRVPLVPASTLTALPTATVRSVLADAPLDEHRTHGTTGIVAHPRAPLPVFDTPGGTPFARMPPAQLGSETWLPVIDQQPGWLRVLLPSQPNGASGWLDANRVTTAHHRYEIRVHLRTARMRLLYDGRITGSWPVLTGTPGRPTPPGRTFLLAVVRRPPQHTPILLHLAAHTGTDHGGAEHVSPGPVAVHPWRAGRPEPAGHGCIRVGDDAMAALAPVPLGCLVRIDDR